MSAGITRFAIQQAAGSDAPAVEADLHVLVSHGFTTFQMAFVVDAIADTRDAHIDPAKSYDLVLSGPDLPGVPTADTGAVVRTLLSHAQDEVLIVGYAIHNGRDLFAPLADRMLANRNLRATFYLDIRRPIGDSTEECELVRRFGAEFRTKHWPWSLLPEVFYDPRSLQQGSNRASLHAKCVIVDRSDALVTSANFTEAAQQRNLEVGVLIRHEATVQRLANFFDGLRVRGDFRACPLT